MSTTFFGYLDTALFFSYSLFQFLSGSIGDNHPKKKILVISFTIQAISFLALGHAASHKVINHLYFYVWFLIIGLS
jgi:sugar phosphate permease